MGLVTSQNEGRAEGWQDVLRREFGAERGSFLIRLRSEFIWDGEAFTRLTAAMAECCRASEGQDVLDRWEASGFWHLSWFVKQWTTHPSFPKEHTKEYYEKAYRELEELALWYFMGMKPSEGERE